WTAGYVLAWGVVDVVVGFLLKLLTIVMVARLATLACRSIFHAVERFGEHHMENNPLRRYWDRVTHLFPFGEKCFEAAVYIYATAKCVALFHFVAFIADYGESIVKC